MTVSQLRKALTRCMDDAEVTVKFEVDDDITYHELYKVGISLGGEDEPEEVYLMVIQ